MFEFTLSKLNLLIFVTAIAAIMLFFLNTVNANLKTRQSFELTYKIGKELKSGIDGKSYCSIKYITIPRTIKTNQGSSNMFNINYKFNIAQYDYKNPNPNSSFNKKLVIAITDQKSKKIYAAHDIDFEGDFIFYESEYDVDTGGYSFTKNEEYGIYDPLKIKSIDTSLLFIKKVNEGKSNYYIIPCEKRNSIYSCKDFVCNNSEGIFDDISCKDVELCSSDLGESSI